MSSIKRRPDVSDSFVKTLPGGSLCVLRVHMVCVRRSYSLLFKRSHFCNGGSGKETLSLCDRSVIELEVVGVRWGVCGL